MKGILIHPNLGKNDIFDAGQNIQQEKLNNGMEGKKEGRENCRNKRIGKREKEDSKGKNR